MANKKQVLALIGFIILIVSLTTLSATDINDTQSTTTSSAENPVKAIEKTAPEKISSPEKTASIEKTSKNNTKQGYATVNVTPENYGSLIDRYGLLRDGDTEYVFQGTFRDLDPLVISETDNVILRGDGASITNWIIEIDKSNNIQLDSLLIENYDHNEYILSVSNSNNVTVKDSVFTIENIQDDDGKKKTRAISVHNSRDVVIQENVILTRGLAHTIDFSGYTPYSDIQAILAIGVQHMSIKDNALFVENSTDSDVYNDATFSNIEAITLKGSGDNAAENNYIENNDITVWGARFVYGINAISNINALTIRNNTITVNSSRYVDGIQVGDKANYVTIEGNRIYGECAKDEDHQNVGDECISYGIISTSNGGTNSTNFTIKDNYININSTYAYGMEIYVSQYNTITNNTIELKGVYPTGIGLGYGHNNQISGNTIRVQGDTTKQVNPVVEHITPTVSGIKTQHFSEEVTIDNNKIETFDVGGKDQAIHIDSNNTYIFDNQLSSSNNEGINAVTVLRGRNVIYDGKDIGVIETVATEISVPLRITLQANQDLIISGKLVEQIQQTGIPGQTVTATIKTNDITVGNTTLTTDNEGQFQYTYPKENINSSSYTVIFTFDKTSNLNASNATVNVIVNISKESTINTEQSINITWKDDLIINGTLLEKEGQTPITNANINVTVKAGEQTTTTTTVTTDENGTFTYTYPKENITSPAYTVFLEFGGLNIYMPSNATVNVGVDLGRTSVINTQSSINMTWKEDLVVNGVLLDESSQTPISGAVISVELTDGENTLITVNTTTDASGEFSYTYPEENITSPAYTVFLEFEGLNNYMPSNATVNVGVDLGRTSVINTQSSINMTWKEDLVVNGVLLDESSQTPISGAVISVELTDGENTLITVNTTTDASGEFSYTYPKENISSQVYTVCLDFEGSANYKGANATIHVTVDLTRKTIISAQDSVNLTRNDDLIITGMLAEEDTGIKIGNANIIVLLKADDSIIENKTVTTDENGTFTYTYPNENITLPAYTVQLTYDGQNNLLPSDKTVNINVDLTKATTIISPAVTDITWKEGLTLIGSLVESDTQAPVTAATINIIIKGEEETINEQTVFTDDNGVFQYTLDKENLNTKTITAIINFPGQGYFLPSNTTLDINVDLTRNTTIITQTELNLNRTDDMIITGRLIETDTEKTITGQNISITISNDDETLINTNIQTDDEGQFQYTYPNENIDSKVYTVYIQYMGQDYLLPTETTVTVNVDLEGAEHYMFVFNDVEELYVEKTANITGTLYYYVNEISSPETVANMPITINIGNEKFETTTQADGTFSIEYLTQNVGTFPITGELDTNITIKNNEKELKVNPKASVNLDTDVAVIGEEVAFNADFSYLIGQADEGKVIFRVNGKTLRDSNGNIIYANVVDGKAQLSDVNITGEWMKPDTTVQAVFLGNNEYEPIFTEETPITVTKPEAEIKITSDLEAKVGEEITLTAEITSGDKLVNSGRVVFKLNGKTLKDENNNVLYADVENGIATVKYIVPAKTRPKDYTLTAVFTDASYNRAEAEETITISK